MTDQEHAQAIENARKALNSAIFLASMAGMRVEIDVDNVHYISQQYPQPLVNVLALRPVRPE